MTGTESALVQELIAYVERNHWWAPGHGDLHAYLEAYTKGYDNRWHRIDSYDRQHPTVALPLKVPMCAAILQLELMLQLVLKNG